MAQIFNIQLGMWSSAFLIVSINTGAYMAVSVRGGIISVERGQMEGAKAIGMTHVHKSVSGALYMYFESATIFMVMNPTMALITSRLLLLLEKTMDGSENYEVVDVMDIGSQLRSVKGGCAHER